MTTETYEQTQEIAQLSKSLSIGIQQARELVGFLADLANVVDGALEDGRITYFEILGFMGLIPGVRVAFEGVREVPAELKDLNENERYVLVETLRLRLRLRNAVTDALAERAFNLVLHLAEFINEVRIARELDAQVSA